MCQCVIAAVEMMIKAAQGQVVFLSDAHSITIDDHRPSQNNQLRRWLDTWTLEGKEVMNKRKFVSETVHFHFVLKQRPEPLMCQLLHRYTQASEWDAHNEPPRQQRPDASVREKSRYSEIFFIRKRLVQINTLKAVNRNATCVFLTFCCRIFHYSLVTMLCLRAGRV